MNLFSGKILLKASMASAVLACSAFANGVIDLGTNNVANWSITGAGANNVMALAVTGIPPLISVSDDGKGDGTFVAGGSAAAFDGYWFANFVFFLPSDAINVVLNFNSLMGDDRIVLRLNGTDIGNEAVDGPGAGMMNFGSGDSSYTFTSGGASGTVTTGFNVGANNTLQLIVNNTHAGRAGTTQTFFNSSDATAAGVLGSVSYDSSAPEPGSVSLMLLGLAPLALRLRRRAS